MQPACHLSAYSRLKRRKRSVKCLIQNDKDWTPNCVDGSFFASSCYPCLDDVHATESGAKGTVVASSIVAQLQIPHQLLKQT